MIALDLDNTIINYEAPFSLAAVRMGLAQEPCHQMTKAEVKALALDKGGNELWTLLQGLTYGEFITAAHPYPGVGEFIRRAQSQGKPLAIVSHKTQYATAGTRWDLRLAASQWLEAQGLLRNAEVAIHFCDTRSAKVEVLQNLHAQALVDDLPEVYLEPGFPAFTRFLLFDPGDVHASWTRTERVSTWHRAAELLL